MYLDETYFAVKFFGTVFKTLDSFMNLMYFIEE